MLLTDKMVSDLSLWPTRARLDHRANYLLGQIDIKERAVLEIGCGRGAFLIWCWANGAKRCLGLEPEADGSTLNTADVFENAISRLGCHTKVELFRGKLEDLPTAEGGNFDIVILYNTVNHLNEEACKVLSESSAARDKYKSLFILISKFLKIGGKMILADCARSNLFGDLGIRNPFSSNIDWNKHQNPKVWKKIVSTTGFDPIALRWYSIYPLRHFGRLFTNRYFAYATFSHFTLEFQKNENSLHHR